MHTHLENTPKYFFTSGNSRIALQACRQAAGYAFERTVLWTIIASIVSYLITDDTLTTVVIGLIVLGTTGYVWLKNANKLAAHVKRILRETSNRIRYKHLGSDDIKAIGHHSLSTFISATLMYDIENPSLLRLEAECKEYDVLAEITVIHADEDRWVWKKYVKLPGTSENCWRTMDDNVDSYCVSALTFLYREFRRRESLEKEPASSLAA